MLLEIENLIFLVQKLILMVLQIILKTIKDNKTKQFINSDRVQNSVGVIKNLLQKFPKIIFIHHQKTRIIRFIKRFW